MVKSFRRFLEKTLKRVFPHFAAWRALQLVRLYAETGFSRKRLAMLEADAQELLKRGQTLDALRTLHCALLLNPKAGHLRAIAKQLVAKHWKLNVSEEVSKDEINAMIDAKMYVFSSYVMQCVDYGSYAKVRVPS